MNPRHAAALLLLAVLTGCRTAPGKPGPADVAARPEQVLDFPTLYRQNCSACHGDRGAARRSRSPTPPILGLPASP